MKTHRRHRKATRRGSATLELILVLPILLIITFAIVQFSITMLVEQAVSHAATVGAREAAKGADSEELACVIRAVLAPHGITIGDCASVTLEDPLATNPVVTEGTFPCGACAEPVLEDGAIRVTVCVDMTKKPFLNPLRYFLGCNSDGCGAMRASAVAHREFSDDAPTTLRPRCGCTASTP